jgi:hypothetical protein
MIEDKTEISDMKFPGLKIESSPQRQRPVAGDPETWVPTVYLSSDR